MSDSLRPHRRQPTRLPYPWGSPAKNTGVGCHFLLQCMKVKSESEVAQSCPTLSDPMDCSPPGSPVHGIFQARVLEWGAIAFSGQHELRACKSPTSLQHYPLWGKVLGVGEGKTTHLKETNSAQAWPSGLLLKELGIRLHPQWGNDSHWEEGMAHLTPSSSSSPCISSSIPLPWW